MDQAAPRWSPNSCHPSAPKLHPSRQLRRCSARTAHRDPRARWGHHRQIAAAQRLRPEVPADAAQAAVPEPAAAGPAELAGLALRPEPELPAVRLAPAPAQQWFPGFVPARACLHGGPWPLPTLHAPRQHPGGPRQDSAQRPAKPRSLRPAPRQGLVAPRRSSHGVPSDPNERQRKKPSSRNQAASNGPRAAPNANVARSRRSSRSAPYW